MSKQLEQLLEQLKNAQEDVEFQDVIEVINDHYDYQPTLFTNGPEDTGVINKAGENEGSCKIFSFARLQQLDEAQTLNCFGRYYREDVLKHPEKTDHQNIRTFIEYGWEHIDFDGSALEKIRD